MDRYSKTDINENESGTKRNEYSFNFNGYIGLTDNITLSARLNFLPEQTLAEGLYDRGGDQRTSFRIAPSFVLSYRPQDNFELFSAFDYSNYTLSYTDTRTNLTNVIGIDEFGNPIYGEDGILIPAIPDTDIMSATIRVGVTFSGSLW
jgi:hypothetical protein